MYSHEIYIYIYISFFFGGGRRAGTALWTLRPCMYIYIYIYIYIKKKKKKKKNNNNIIFFSFQSAVQLITVSHANITVINNL